jgi:hypothetical protein
LTYVSGVLTASIAVTMEALSPSETSVYFYETTRHGVSQKDVFSEVSGFT